jgi:hypothetical protein
VGVTRPPEVLPKGIVGIAGVVNEERQHTDATEHDGWEHDQYDAGHTPTLSGHW